LGAQPWLFDIDGVDHLLAVDVEQEGVNAPFAVIGIAAVGDFPGDDLPGVLDQARALGDLVGREHAAAVDLRIAHGERPLRSLGCLGLGGHV